MWAGFAKPVTQAYGTHHRGLLLVCFRESAHVSKGRDEDWEFLGDIQNDVC